MTRAIKDIYFRRGQFVIRSYTYNLESSIESFDKTCCSYTFNPISGDATVSFLGTWFFGSPDHSKENPLKNILNLIESPKKIFF